MTLLELTRLMLGPGIIAAFISGVFAIWVAVRIERLKNKFDREKQELSNAFQKTLEGMKLDFEKIKSNHTLHIKNEYELYEEIYPKIYAIYVAVNSTRAVNAEFTKIELSLGARDAIVDMRERSIVEAYITTRALDEIETRRPFIPNDVYKEIRIFSEMCSDTLEARIRPSEQGDGPPQHRESTIDDFKNQLDAICCAIKSRLKVIDD